jgi:FAD/FMN-containing dehydrogenase
MNWGKSPQRQDMAYSVADETYIALYAVWSDPADDAANLAWAEDHMRAMEPLASGIQLADENLGRRPARFLSDANYERIDRVRAQYDRDGLFHTWMGRP